MNVWLLIDKSLAQYPRAGNSTSTAPLLKGMLLVGVIVRIIFPVLFTTPPPNEMEHAAKLAGARLTCPILLALANVD